MTLAARFSSKYEPVTETGCWIWTASIGGGGYGQIGSGGRKQPLLAHRASWQIHFGQIPDGMQVCHKCDVKLCVNPDHLFLGSQIDNMQDMIRKGRNWIQRHPEFHPNAIKKVCKYGHPFTPENTKIRNNGSRQCIACIPRLNAIRNAKRK